jgi:hypothetical protein
MDNEKIIKIKIKKTLELIESYVHDYENLHSININKKDISQIESPDDYISCKDIVFAIPKEYFKELSEEEVDVLYRYPNLILDHVNQCRSIFNYEKFIYEFRRLDLKLIYKIMTGQTHIGSRLKSKMENYSLSSMKITLIEIKNKNSFKNQNKLTEKKLEYMIIQEIESIEDGMRFIDSQVPIDDGGRIDILARDINEKLCIIELKVVDNCSDLIKQCAYYPTQFAEDVRMIAVCPDYNNKNRKALSRINDVELKIYNLNQNKIYISDYMSIEPNESPILY